MTPEKLFGILEPVQNEKGYYFNPDMEWVLDILSGVLKNKERYGYGSCPCRLATGKRETDSDIICPCIFRDEDIAKYGQCFCCLYVSQDVRDGKPLLSDIVPERWFRKK